MKFIKDNLLFTVAVLMLFVMGIGAALAGTATATWTNPTAYTDGSALVSTDITQTRVEYGTCAAGSTSTFGTASGQVIAAGAVTTISIPNLGPGTWCFRAYTTAKGVESGPSNVGSKVITQPAPNPPTLGAISVAAYKMRQTIDGFSMVAIGTVNLGTPCNTSYSVNGYSVVPRSAVTLSSKFDTLPLVVYASCG
jgi:hypothetical protein